MHDWQIFIIIIIIIIITIIIIIINFFGFAYVKLMFLDALGWCSLRVIYDYVHRILW